MGSCGLRSASCFHYSPFTIHYSQFVHLGFVEFIEFVGVIEFVGFVGFVGFIEFVGVVRFTVCILLSLFTTHYSRLLHLEFVEFIGFERKAVTSDE